jgi:hypothetical protein
MCIILTIMPEYLEKSKHCSPQEKSKSAFEDTFLNYNFVINFNNDFCTPGLNGFVLTAKNNFGKRKKI